MNLPSNTSVALCMLVVPLAAGTIVNAQGPILGRIDAATTEGVLLPARGLQPASGRPVRQVSVNEAVELALDHNLGIRSERFNPQIQDMVVADARSVWLPNLSVDVLRNNATNPASSFLAGGDDQIIDKLFNNVFTVDQQMPWAGGRYTVGWDGSRSSTTNFFSSFDPILQSNMQLSYVQPLLRNFSIDAARQQVQVATTNREIADVGLRQAIVSTERNVRNAYWDLVFAISSLEVQRQSLALAQESLRNNRARVEVGTMAPIDIVEAEAEVARNEEAVIIAETAIEQGEDVLRTLILDPAAPDFWSVRIEPTDEPLLRARQIDVDEAIRTALDRRTDLDQLRAQMTNTDVNIAYFSNQRLPDVDLQVDYALTGLGGTEFIRGLGFPGPIVGQEERAFSEVLGDLFSNSFPTWSVGVRIGYPLGRSTADANHARARLERSQTEARLLEVEVRVTGEVREVGRRVSTNLQRVDATRIATELAARRLEAEQKKFDVGMSTSFLVFQAQRDLSQSRNRELQAVLDYIKSLVDFEAVQEVPLGGGGLGVGGVAPTTAGVVAPGAGQAPVGGAAGIGGR